MIETTDYGQGNPQMTNHQNQLAFTITQFCTAVGISRRTLYTLWERNQGPPRVAVGKRVLIPRQCQRFCRVDVGDVRRYHWKRT